jgi:hypothetical protein
MTKPAGVGEMNRDLGVAFVPAVAGVLALNPDRADAAPRVPTWTVDGNEIMLARRLEGGLEQGVTAFGQRTSG